MYNFLATKKLYNKNYINCLPPSFGGKMCKPGRRVGKKGLLLQGHPRPWPFAKPRTFGSPAPKVPHRIRSVNRETPSPAPIKASCRHVQHSCGSAQHQRSTVLTSRPAHLWHCSSMVNRERFGSSPAAIPPGSRSPPSHGHPLRIAAFPSLHPIHGPSRPRSRRESGPSTVRRSLPGSGSLMSPIPRTVKPAFPTLPDTLRNRRSTTFRAIGGLETLPHTTPTHQRLQTTNANQEKHASAPSRNTPISPALEEEKRRKNQLQWAAAAPLPGFS